jgi:hypothetical protein
MDANNVRFCILLRPDEATEKVLGRIYDDLKRRHPDLIVKAVADGALPYHMTMIAGIVLSSNSYKEKIRSIVGELKPFQNKRWLPRAVRVEPSDGIGNVLAVRFVFSDEHPYLLTGSEIRNKQIVDDIAKGFFFDKNRHISIADVLYGNSKSEGLGNMNQVLPLFVRLVAGNQKLLSAVTFTPEVWWKVNESWALYDLS